jgi:hypothetical protein
VLETRGEAIRYPEAGDGKSLALQDSTIFDGSSHFAIGTNGDGRQLIDDVKVWERELTVEEVERLARFDPIANADTNGKTVLCPADNGGNNNEGGGDGETRIRCTAEDADADADVALALSVRVLSSKLVVVVSDPTTFLKHVFLFLFLFFFFFFSSQHVSY